MAIIVTLVAIHVHVCQTIFDLELQCHRLRQSPCVVVFLCQRENICVRSVGRVPGTGEQILPLIAVVDDGFLCWCVGACLGC